MDALVAFVLPVTSTLLGAGITYWINVRNRRQTKREDVFHEAIGAVAVVEASRVTLTGLPPWKGASPGAFEEFMQELGKSQHLAYVHALASARAAVARASAYDPGLVRLLDKPDPFGEDTNGPAIMGRLRAEIGQSSEPVLTSDEGLLEGK